MAIRQHSKTREQGEERTNRALRNIEGNKERLNKAGRDALSSFGTDVPGTANQAQGQNLAGDERLYIRQGNIVTSIRFQR